MAWTFGDTSTFELITDAFAAHALLTNALASEMDLFDFQLLRDAITAAHDACLSPRIFDATRLHGKHP